MGVIIAEVKPKTALNPDVSHFFNFIIFFACLCFQGLKLLPPDMKEILSIAFFRKLLKLISHIGLEICHQIHKQRVFFIKLYVIFEALFLVAQVKLLICSTLLDSN